MIMNNRKGHRRINSWYISRYCPSNYLQRVRKTIQKPVRLADKPAKFKLDTPRIQVWSVITIST